MKKIRDKSGSGKTFLPKLRNHALFSALVAAGVISCMPSFAASLPTVCAGTCGPSANLPFQVGLPTVSTSTSGTAMTITQTSPTAILNWQNFNIDKDYSVNFVQPSSTASALNRIWDANPSMISGALTANGQIYLINHNGIIFGNGAQVNADTLVASSLDITDALFQNGYLTNTQLTPAFSGNSGFVRVDTGAVLNGSRIMMFAPVVENSGSITTADGQAVLAAGTRVFLEASQDPNLRGVLVEVDLAQVDANGDKVLDANGNPISLAGLADTNRAGQVQNNAAGTVSNFGSILAQRGNDTLIGFAVNQQGIVSATTSVTENGSVKLLARYNVSTDTTATFNQAATNANGFNSYDIRATQTGKVTLAAGSVTTVTPEEVFDPKLNMLVPDPATTTDDQLFNPSIVEVMGNTIEMQGGSSIVAPGGKVTLAAVSSYDPVLKTGLNPTTGFAYQQIDKSNAYSSFFNPGYIPVSAAGDQARVFLDSGSKIDVKGSQAVVSVARNILTVQLRGSELADAPLQRNGFLKGKDVYVDIRQGTTLANYSGEEAQIGRTVAERTSAGGDVKLVSTGDVVMKNGAKVDISGGQVEYKRAFVNTTALISNGIAYDITKASPNLIYDGIVGTYTLTHNKWGVSERWNTMAGGTWDPGYIEGKSAGTLTVMAPHAVIDSDIVANTVAGIYQRKPFVAAPAGTPYKDTWQMMPQGGSLVIGNSNAPTDANGITDYLTDSNVTIQTGVAPLASGFPLFSKVVDPVTELPVIDPVTGLQKEITTALPTGLQQDIFLGTNLFSGVSSLDRLAVYSNKTVSVADGTTVKLAAGGSFTLQGDTVNMLGTIDAPSGTVKLGTAATGSSVDQLAGALSVGAASAGSSISTRGQWANDSTLLGAPDWSKPLSINGGSITLSSGGDLLVASGTLLDASGGAWLDTSNKYHGGNGGAITLKSGKTNSVQFKTQLDGVDLRSYGTAGGKGGSLNIAASDIVLGGAGNGNNTTLELPAEFFQNGGFTGYNLAAQYGSLTVTAGSVIEPRAQLLVLDRTASMHPSGSDVAAFATTGLLPDWLRPPASITLAANNAALNVEEGAVIRVEPTASISLSASNQLTVLGTLDAPAGNISLSLKKLDGYSPSQSIWLGSQSKLLSHGYFLQSQPNALNLTQGQVLAGGKININANTGYVVAQQGSLLDVSGVSADLDMPQIISGQLHYRRSHVAGDAGSISVQTSEGAFFDGSMNAGFEAGSQAAAGKLSLTLNNSEGINNITNNIGMFPLNPAQILVMASGNGGFATQAGLTPGNDANAGQVSINAIAGKAILDASALQRSGFDQVTLKSDNKIVLADQVNLQTRRSITLDAPELVSNGNITVSSSQVTLGNLDTKFQELLDPLDPLMKNNLAPTAGTGVLNISGQMVDMTGNFLVSGVSQLNVSSSGDIRLNGVIDSTKTALTGSLSTQGNVSLQADQVYPSTLAQFTLSVEDGLGNPAGNITVLPGQHSPSAAMSAGGQLTLSAAEIVQRGAVKAPLGTINLNGSQSVTLGAASLTSVSAAGQTIPFGLIQGGNSWMYDLTGTGAYLSTISTPPQKQVKFTAPDINVQSGATVDLSGGGDLYAYEFFAGSGGSVNVLDPVKAAANTFAILPGMSGFAPYDPQYTGQYSQTGSNTTLQPGSSVYISGGKGIPAGYYTLLPASYALLPGAYRVTALPGYTDMQPGMGAITLNDGTQIMAGKFAAVGTDILDMRYSGFAVTPSAVVRTQSEYHDSYANQFFAVQASTNGTPVPRSPVDAGQLIVSAVGNVAILALDGIINAQPGAGGRGSLVDLNGPAFDIVNTTGPANGMVQLTTDSLNNLGADSLLIGGVRTQSTSGMTIAVGASKVVVDNAGSVLSGPEIIMAANEAVSVKTGSDIEGKGAFSGLASDITIGSATVNGDGALLRVSSAEQVSVTRTRPAAAAVVPATLTIEDGATVGAENALLLDSSYVTTVGNNAILNGKSFSVAAQNIDIGTNPAPSGTSLALSGALLARALAFDSLTLHSYNDINFYGAASLGGLDANQQHTLSDLVLNTRSLNGFDNAGQTNVIDAANITLVNNNTGTPAAPAYGAGNLTINADLITLATGDKSIQGFDTVTLAVAGQIVGQGTGSVTVSAGDTNTHSLVLQAGQITGTNKSDLTITANNDDITIQPVAGAATPATEALNAKLNIAGKSIADNGIIDLAAGSVTLHATGTGATDGVTLGSGSRIAATGLSKTISGQTRYAQAGTVSLTSDHGGVDIQSGALVDVSGAVDGGDAGSINISATNGAVTVTGDLHGSAAANYAQGSFTLDAKTLALNPNTLTGNALTDLNDTLTAGSFSTLRDMRIRTGDLVLDPDAPGTIRAKAQTFRLTADTGKIDVLGTVDGSGTGGGNILLAAQNNVTLNPGALLDAHANVTGQTGGKVALETSVGQIDLNNQLIDVHGSVLLPDGSAQLTGGSVLLRAPRINANTDVALNNTGGTSLNVSSGASVTVEAFKTYVAPASLTAANAATTTTVYNNDATAFTNNATAIKTRLGMLGDPNQHLTPGVELDSAGDLTLATNLDLSTWRFNDGNGGVTEPGILTFRAGGNLNFGSGGTTASLTDGFTTANNVITSTGGVFTTLTPTTTASWSYRLAAGADLTSADVMAVNNTVPKTGVTTTGNVALVAGKEVVATGNYAYNGTTNLPNTFTMEQIRTGTGFIDISAGGNLSLGNKDSVIYTAGQASTAVGFPAGINRHFGVNGGDITVRVKGDVIGAATDELITDWQWRQGAMNADGSIKIQPAWWINVGSFRQNIATLGGGDVSVNAGGNINNLSVSAATSGYLDTATQQTVVLGGGDVNVTAGKNINSGIFYVGNGLGTIRAGGDLGTSRQNGSGTKSLYTVLALGQGHYDVRTGGDLNLQAVLNPTVLPTSWSQNPTGGFNTTSKIKNYFFTYGEGSGVSLTSLSGNVALNGAVAFNATKSATSGFFYLNTTDIQGVSVYPGSLIATALNGDISSNSNSDSNGFSMFPSTSGDLEFVAANDIKLGGSAGLTMSDAALQATAVTSSISTLTQNLRSGHNSVHAQDGQPVILSAGGNIGGSSAASIGGLYLPESAQIQAGQNVQNLGLSAQNLNDTDTTSIVAGKDISYVSAIVYGPGQVFLQAGGNVDLGSSVGIVTKGNLLNPLLPEQGAGVSVLAGVGQGATDMQSFIDRYIDPVASATYGADLIAFVGDNGAPLNLSADQAFAYFNTLSKPIQDEFVRQVFFSELRSSGRSVVSTGDYQKGYDAIATLFPASGYKGDINLYYSQIKTMRGGDINLLTPGGGVNAGLANPSATVVQKQPSELGIVTVKGGDVNAFVNYDFLVNQSRVFTLQGGNILMWSSYGNIDAGKGSKSVSSTPPPLLIVDPKTGAFNVDVTQSVVGSGIRVLLANKDVVPGSVDLFAPSGEINAGDAGIGAAGDIFLGALHVVGADNINFGGTGIGVPVTTVAPVSVSGIGNMQDASKAAEQATQSVSTASESMASFQPSFLSVEVIGLGDEGMSLQP